MYLVKCFVIFQRLEKMNICIRMKVLQSSDWTTGEVLLLKQ